MRSLHQQGITHGNLKPENIFVYSDNPIIRLSDMLFYGPNNNIITLNSVVSSSHIRYLSPEVIFLHHPRTESSDIWSIGIILLELCFGYYSFGTYQYRSIDPDTIMKIFQNSEFSELMICFILECLNLQTQLRSPISKLLKHPWLKSFSPSTLSSNFRKS